MSSPVKGKGTPAPAEERRGAGLEQALDALEVKVEGLAARLRDVSAENARLRGAVEETVAERDRLAADLVTAREIEACQLEASDRLARYESEREALRARIERLVATLSNGDADAEDL